MVCPHQEFSESVKIVTEPPSVSSAKSFSNIFAVALATNIVYMKEFQDLSDSKILCWTEGHVPDETGFHRMIQILVLRWRIRDLFPIVES